MTKYMIHAGTLVVIALASTMLIGIERLVRSGVDQTSVAWRGECRPIKMEGANLLLSCGGRSIATYDGGILYLYGKGTLKAASCTIFRDKSSVCRVPKGS